MIGWQNIIAWGLVGLAAGYLLRKAWRRIAGPPAGACGACAHCGTAGPDDARIPSPRSLVQIEFPSDDGTHGQTDHAAK